MNVLDGKIAYMQSRNIEGSNIRIDYYTGYVENKATFEKRKPEEDPSTKTKLGPVFSSSIGNVKMIYNVILGLCESIARTNESVYDTKISINVSYDNSIKLGKNYIVTIFLPDLNGCMIVHCDHLYMDMVNTEKRYNDIYNIKIEYFDKTEGILSDSGDGRDPAFDLTQLNYIITEISEEEVTKNKNYDSTITRLFDLLAKDRPNTVPSDDFIIDNIFSNELVNLPPAKEPEPEPKPIRFGINPSLFNLKVGETATFEIEGSVDQTVTESLKPSVFTVKGTTITAIAEGSGKLKVTAKKKGYLETTKEFSVNVLAEEVPGPIIPPNTEEDKPPVVEKPAPQPEQTTPAPAPVPPATEENNTITNNQQETEKPAQGETTPPVENRTENPKELPESAF